jgi:hypothetical protein
MGQAESGTLKKSEALGKKGERQRARAGLPAPCHPSSLLTPASPSPCFSSSCSILVVPGAAGSNWMPPEGAEAVWSKSAGRLLMGDLGSEGRPGSGSPHKDSTLRTQGSPCSPLPLLYPPPYSVHPGPLPTPPSAKSPPSHGRQTLLGGGPPTPEAAVLKVWLLEEERVGISEVGGLSLQSPHQGGGARSGTSAQNPLHKIANLDLRPKAPAVCLL